MDSIRIGDLLYFDNNLAVKYLFSLKKTGVIEEMLVVAVEKLSL